MKEVQVKMWDDLAFADGEQRVEADQTLRLVLGDQATELDLTEDHAKELRELLARYFDAGTPPGELRKTARPAPNGPKVGSRDYNAGMRAYADARGINYRNTSNRSPYYPVTLQAEYAAYLRGEGQ